MYPVITPRVTMSTRGGASTHQYMQAMQCQYITSNSESCKQTNKQTNKRAGVARVPCEGTLAYSRVFYAADRLFAVACPGALPMGYSKGTMGHSRVL